MSELDILERDIASQAAAISKLQRQVARIRGRGTDKWQGRRVSSLSPIAAQVAAWNVAKGLWEWVSAATPGAHDHDGAAHIGLTPDNHHAASHLHASHPGDANSHHTESHTVASHSDTSAMGPQLDKVTDGSEVDTEHTHPVTIYIPIGSESEDGLIVAP